MEMLGATPALEANFSMRRALAILVLLTSLAGAYAATIPASHIPARLREAGVPSVSYTPDRRYWVPDVAWLREEFLPAWKKESKRFRYEPEAFDCDDFARSLVAFAAEEFHRTQFALPVATVHYRKDSGIGHAIVLFLVATPDRKIVPMFVEPDGGYLILLSKMELRSIFRVDF